VAVEAVDGGGADSDQELVVPGSRALHLLDAEDVGRPVAVIYDGFHINRESGTVRARRYRRPSVAGPSPALRCSAPRRDQRTAVARRPATTCDGSPARRAAARCGEREASIGWIRQGIEWVNDTPKCQLDLERHGRPDHRRDPHAARAIGLIGVFISLTTIPAASIGVSIASWSLG
jgi:hypothetical protein